MLLIHNAVTSDHFVECETCGMKFWIGDGHFDRGKAEAAHKTYANNHPIKPVWLRKSVMPEEPEPEERSLTWGRY